MNKDEKKLVHFVHPEEPICYDETGITYPWHEILPIQQIVHEYSELPVRSFWMNPLGLKFDNKTLYFEFAPEISEDDKVRSLDRIEKALMTKKGILLFILTYQLSRSVINRYSQNCKEAPWSE